MKLLHITISDMKMIWVYVMLANGTGFVALLLSAVDVMDVKGLSTSVIIRFALCLLFFILTLLAFINARKLGLVEDKIKGLS